MHKLSEVDFAAMLPLIEALLVEGDLEARRRYANHFSEMAVGHRVYAFTHSQGHRYGFGDRDATSPDWSGLDRTGDLTRALECLQRAAVYRAWAQFLRDPGGVMWKCGQ